MTRDEVIDLFNEAGDLAEWKPGIGNLMRFAELVAKQAREECAEICDRFALRNMHPAECAAAIRARGTP